MKKQINTTIKAHLTRSALYLFLLLAVCAIPFALAQRNATHRTVAPMINATADLNPATGVDQTHPPLASGGSGLAPLGIPAYPKAPQVVLYDQYDDASVIGTLSATFTDFPQFNSDLADDFVVPAGQTWNVQSIDADGLYLGPGPANSFNVFFYADNAGLPGAQVYSAMNQPFSVVGSTFTVNLPSVAVLTEGTYWVEIQANMTFVPDGAWVWRDRTVQSNQGAAWQNPAGGFGFCQTWTLKTTCIPIAGGPDQVFRLNGTMGEASPTPTSSPIASPTATTTATTSPTPTATATATATATFTPTPTATATATSTPTPTSTPTGTPTTCGSSFVIGDQDAAVGNHVTFWGAHWSRLNHLSGGSAPASFKGFANCTTPNPPACGGTWVSDPGNSSHPPATVPADMTVIVSSLITKSGHIESGDIPKMVTIHTDPGYEPNPGHAGTGTVTSVVCGNGPQHPVVTTNPATNLTTSSAKLHGSLDPHGLATTVHFQYGRTTSYGHTTAMQSQTGNTYRNIASHIGGLTTDTTYHFRIVATNSAGTRMGSDRTFTTP